jgi:hypothetical protein
MADTQEPQGTSSAATEPSTHEWDAQADSFYGGEAQPTGGDSTATAPATSQASPPPTGNPVWRAVKSLARGINVGINNTMATVAEAAVESQSTPLKRMALRNTAFYGPFADAVAGKINDAVGGDMKKASSVGINSEEELNAVYGAKPADGLGAFIHGAGQLAGGTAMMYPAFGPWAAFAAGGTAFDPYEETLGEIGAKHQSTLRKIPLLGAILANASHLLSSDETDSPTEARFKNAIEGEAFGRTTMFLAKGAIGSVRLLGTAVKEAKAGNHAAAAKAAAEAAAPPAPNPSDVVEVVKEADGTFVVKSLKEDLSTMPEEAIGKELDEITARSAAAKELSEGVKPEGSAYHPDEIAKAQERGQLLRDELARRRATEVPLSTVDVMRQVKELGLEADVRAEAAMRGGSAADAENAARTVLHEHLNKRSLKAAADADPVRTVYTDEAAARSDAATINAVAYEDMRAAQMFTPDDMALHIRTAGRLRAGDVAALSDSPNFNLQSMGTSLDVDAQVQAITKEFSDLYATRQGRPSVPNEVLHDAAEKWAAQVKLENFLPAMARADVAGRVDLSLKAALYAAAMKQSGQEVAEIGMLLSAKPGDDALTDLMRRRLQTFFNVSEATANFNSELGRGLQALSARGDESAARIRFGSPVTPRASIMTPKGAPAPAHPPVNVAAMSPAQVASMGRLFARSGGDPRVVAHVVDAMNKAARENAAEWAGKSDWGWTGKNAEQLSALFVNSVISGFKTFATIGLSGATMNAFRATAKVMAGAGTANRGLAEEGAAQWYSLVKHSTYAIRGAWGAFKQNRSLLDGTPPFHVDPSKVMKAVTVPGRVAGALDEFTRTAAYRADEFSAAFRQAREDGLSLVDAVKRAEYDMKQSVDEATGIGLNTIALKRAGVPTLSDNLGTDNLIGKMSNTMSQYPLTKFAVPFIRPSVNTFRWTWANTPLLNKHAREAKQILLNGGEEATVLHTQTALVGSMVVYGMSKVMDQEITGAGPKDPTLRRMWGKQPYSIKINGKWHSYRRTEPFASFLGMVADVSEIYGETPDQDKDEFEEKVMSAMGAVVAGFARNVTSKSWTESLLDFFSAVDDKDDHATVNYLKGVGRGLIPYSSALKSFNDDPVWREVRTVVDGVRATVPGYSETLPANYDWSGGIEARQGSLWNRNFSAYPEHEAEQGVEDILIDNFIRLAPPNPRPFKGIDMHDKQWALPDGRTPYMVFMEKLKATGVRKLVEDVVKTPGFKNAPQGTRAYPQSLRNDMVSAIVGGQTERALWEMMSEFQGKGKFADAYINARYVVPAIAKGQGQEAADSVKSLYGISTSITR